MHTHTISHTVEAAGAGKAGRFVTFAGAQAGAADAVLGAAMVDYKAGDLFAAHVLGACSVEAGGAVPAGSWVKPDADGRAVADDGTAANRVGRALGAVTGPGQTLLILIR